MAVGWLVGRSVGWSVYGRNDFLKRGTNPPSTASSVALMSAYRRQKFVAEIGQMCGYITKLCLVTDMQMMYLHTLGFPRKTSKASRNVTSRPFSSLIYRPTITDRPTNKRTDIRAHREVTLPKKAEKKH